METTRALTKTGGITETGLKWIALVTMVMDHIHYFFGFTGAIPEWFSMAGRVSAPLFLFCLVEGFTHTHSRKKYFAKVYILSAAMSALLFFMAFGGILVRPDGFYPGNGMMTTFAVLMVIWQGIDWLRQRRLGRALALVGGVGVLWPAVSLALVAALPPAGQLPLYFLSWTVLPNWAFSTDGGVWFILGGVLLYALRGRRKIQILAWAAWAFWIDMGSVSYLLRMGGGVSLGQAMLLSYQWMEVFAAPLMLLYNGQRGAGHKQLFYWFYPAHVYGLYAVSCVWILFRG